MSKSRDIACCRDIVWINRRWNFRNTWCNAIWSAFAGLASSFITPSSNIFWFVGENFANNGNTFGLRLDTSHPLAFFDLLGNARSPRQIRRQLVDSHNVQQKFGCLLNLKAGIKDVRSPDTRLSLACLSLARLRLNNGAKLWVSFNLCFKTNNFYGTYWRIIS